MRLSRASARADMDITLMDSSGPHPSQPNSHVTTRMPRSWQRTVAIVGMVAVVPLATWLFALGYLAATGVFENGDPSDYARGAKFAVLAAVGGAAAVISMIGLATRRRAVAAVGAVAVDGCATLVLLNWHTSEFGISRQGTAFAAVLVAVILVGFGAFRAAFARISRRQGAP